jgi:hypothetical protein
MITDAEIKHEGIRALTASLGVVGAERFIALLTREPFDYTRWQRALWPEATVEELSHRAMAFRKTQEGSNEPQ